MFKILFLINLVHRLLETAISLANQKQRLFQGTERNSQNFLCVRLLTPSSYIPWLELGINLRQVIKKPSTFIQRIEIAEGLLHAEKWLWKQHKQFEKKQIEKTTPPPSQNLR